ncbi:MAG: hypothetical protein M0R51_15480 [Clostridia bacterium]|nr:hypothetical protein [Clostridia bacterium]
MMRRLYTIRIYDLKREHVDEYVKKRGLWYAFETFVKYNEKGMNIEGELLRQLLNKQMDMLDKHRVAYRLSARTREHLWFDIQGDNGQRRKDIYHK